MPVEFVNSVSKRLLGKQVEIYIAQDYDCTYYADNEVYRKAVLVGKLIDYDDCLLILETESKNLVYVNSWHVCAILESGTSLSSVLFPSMGGGKK